MVNDFGPRFSNVVELGRGASSTVWEAFDHKLGQTVALKKLVPECASQAEFQRRIKREASVLGSLSGPPEPIAGIVTLLDFDASNWTLVLERIEGTQLEEKLGKRTAAPWHEVLEWMAPLLLTLASVHSRGIVHGDLKPSNVFVDTPGCPIRLIDFGVAKVEGLDRLTNTGEFAGTLRYGAPEQLMGRDVTPSADLYSVAAMAVEHLMGRPIFEAKHPGALIFQITQGVDPSRLPGPEQLRSVEAEVLRKMLHKDSSCRYVTATDVLAQLRI